MTTWRGCTCAVGYCNERASLDIRTLPLCHDHGWEVARAFRERILYEAEEREIKAATRRFEVYQAERGNRTGAVVYYARIGDYIKIGYSTRLRNRLSSLRVDQLLAYEPGSPELERQRHEEFATERIDRRRENFRPSDRLDAHIAALRDQHGLPEWATRPRTSVVTIRHKGDPK